MRKFLLAANWKMNMLPSQMEAYFSEFASELEFNAQKVELLFALPYLHLSSAQQWAKKLDFHLASQNLHQEAFGAYTGEVSAAMLTDIGISSTLIGHSERRQYYNETDEVVAAKLRMSAQAGMRVVLCVGESLEEKDADKTEAVLEKQLNTAFDALESWQNIDIAYEPVWAIGTGLSASPEQAQQTHAWIRSLLEARFGGSLAAATRILYGGSVNAEKAPGLFKQQDIDGALVGGASLKPKEFAALYQLAKG